MRILMDFCAIPNAGQDMTELARFAGNNALAISATMVPSAEKNLMVEELGKFLACTVAQMKSLTEHFATPSAIPGTMALVPFAGNIVIQASLITGRLVLSTFSTGTSSPLMAVALVRYPIIDAAPTKIMMLACVILSARQGTMASDPSAGWVALQL
mmetsp:Transcript_8047/g.14264  ORF Transcript_8047/g.14264 Transcript_8047/m.14264 type:complete len:156 (+) Transcript_8047:447-914(+)